MSVGRPVAALPPPGPAGGQSHSSTPRISSLSPTVHNWFHSKYGFMVLLSRQKQNALQKYQCKTKKTKMIFCSLFHFLPVVTNLNEQIDLSDFVRELDQLFLQLLYLQDLFVSLGIGTLQNAPPKM